MNLTKVYFRIFLLLFLIFISPKGYFVQTAVPGGNNTTNTEAGPAFVSYKETHFTQKGYTVFFGGNYNRTHTFENSVGCS